MQHPKALKGVLGCKTLSPKRSVGVQNPKELKGVLGCKALSSKRSVGLQNLEALKRLLPTTTTVTPPERPL